MVSAVALRPFLYGVCMFCMFCLCLRGFLPGSPTIKNMLHRLIIQSRSKYTDEDLDLVLRLEGCSLLLRGGLMQRTNVGVHHCVYLLLLSVNPLCVYIHSKYEVS